jgi:amino acid adenylation domain-containing protein/non-ribosomal peptide synthase protein (TIGR01720 family)
MAPPNTLLTDGAHTEHVAFWTAALGTFAEDFHFRQPWLSTAAGTTAWCHEECTITPPTAALIDKLGNNEDIGALVVVVSAAAFLLHTYSHADVIAVDTPPLAGAGLDDGARELVPLIASIDPTEDARDFMKRIGEMVASSYSYHPFPVGLVADRLLHRRRPTTNVLVTFAGLHDAAPNGDDHDLRIIVSRTPSLRISIEGRAPAFSPDYVHTFARHLSGVLASFTDLSRPLGQIDIMGDDERHRLLVEYNATGEGATPDQTIHTLFEHQVRRAGSSVAIQLNDVVLTYDALNRTANKLARSLQVDYGVAPGDVIGVVTHRSPQIIAGLLGVLKAGAVYLPIDPEYPEERLRFMVADAGVKVLLVHSEHFERLAPLYETPMFALDIQLETLDTADTDLNLEAVSTQLAYIIYTSGSTGQPKAVLLEHRGFVNMVRHHIDLFGVDPSDRLLQFYAHSFDSSLFEIFVSLLSGATLVMVEQDTINDPESMSAYIVAQQITTLTLPPVYLSTLGRDHLAGVRRFISAGDHCRVEDALLLAGIGDYYNSYGPTETSVCVTHYKVDPQQRYGSRIPVGKPITGTSIYLLDDRLQPVPEGVVGEICVGGVSLARGYLNRDELTAERFVTSPFQAGERLYLTGDVGVWLPDGNLEVIGRKDTQVKIRGYRVELGEIESVLDQYPLVEASAVIASEDDTGHKRLIAYVTGTAGPIETVDLKSLLRSRLPEFMIPSMFTVLDRMPLTANGKIDRKALPSSVEPVAPVDPSAGQAQTPTQEALVGIWRDVLGVPRVGIHDNIFDVGGDSILIIQIVSRAREAGLKLTPNQLFDHQTVAELAEVATVVQPAVSVSAEQGLVEGPSPLTPMQAWFFAQRFADPHHFNQSVCLEVPAGDLDHSSAAAAAQALLAHHDALRLCFEEAEGGWTALYAPLGAEAPFDVVDLSGIPTDQRDVKLRDAVLARQASFDLSTGPLFHVTVFQLGDGGPSRLLFAAHHLAVDGVSWRILLADFFTVYAQIGRGDPVELPAKTTSYRSWATQLAPVAAELAGHMTSSLEEVYWYADHGGVGSLPTDHAHAPAANTVGSAREVTRALDADVTTALLQDVPRVYTTEINDVLLSGLALTLQAWTGRDHILFDLEGHGREDLLDEADTSRTVGWFTSQFPVLLRLDPGASPGDVIKSVKEQLRAVPRRGADYGLLRYLSGSRPVIERLEARPAPEVLFNYFGQAGRVLAPELQWALVPGSVGSDVSLRAARAHLLAINAIVENGRLAITWTYSDAVHERSTIENLAVRYEDTLQQLVDHCRTVTATQYTPSDFPAAGLDQGALDALIAKISH